MRRAVVIGASRGVGAYLARRFAENGWDVTGVARGDWDARPMGSDSPEIIVVAQTLDAVQPAVA